VKKQVIVVASLVLMIAGLVGIITPTSVSAINVDPKVNICHRTNSVTNPYTKNSVNRSSVDGFGNGDHYKEHKGPLASSQAVASFYKAWHIEWGDIIPPVPGFHNGLNWTTEGQAIYNNDCNYVTSVTPKTVTFVDPTCDTEGKYIIPSKTGVVYKVDGQVVAANEYTAQPGETVTVTAEAASAAYTLTGKTSWTHEFAIPKDCEEEVANISYGVVCSAEGAVITFTNSGNADGEVTLNGETIPVIAGATVERTLVTTDAGVQVTITIDEVVVYDELVICDDGEVLGTTDTPTTLPNTSGNIAPILIGLVAGLSLIAGLASLAIRSALTRQ